VGGGQTNLVLVSFNPTAEGSFTNGLVFISNGGNSTNGVGGSAAFVPVASFSGSPTSGFWPLTVNFSNTSTGTITNTLWDFGDGTTSNSSAVSLTHTYAGPGTNTVSLTGSGPVGTNTMTLPGYVVVTNLPPKLILNPTNVIFGGVMVGQSLTQQVQVFNPGQLVLTGSVAVASPFGIAGASTFSVDAGQTNQVLITFIPTVTGSFSNALVFVSNGGNSTNAVTGSGLSPAQLTVQPASLDFGIVRAGTTAQASFTVTNNGNATANDIEITIDGGPFSIAVANSFDLPGNSSTNVLIQFAPSSEGFFSNNVIVAIRAGSSYTNRVVGTGAIEPQANFSATPIEGFWPLIVSFTDNSTGTITNRFWTFGDGTTTNTSATQFLHRYSGPGTDTVSMVATGPVGTNTMTRTDYIVVTNLPPKLVISPTNLNLGAVIVGQSRTQQFDVINTGQLVLTGSVAVASPFGIASGSSFIVNPGQTGQVQVSFSPVQAGSFNGNALFSSNGGNSTNAVAGIGAAPAQIGVSPATLDFGVVLVGTNRQASFVATNIGDITASNVVVTVGGGPFGILSGNSFNLPAHTSTNISVQFTPGSEAVFSNYVSIVSANAGSSTNGVTGIGTTAVLASFVGNPTSGNASLTVNFTDNSTGTITNRSWNFGDGSGTNTTASTVAHTYTLGGTYTVSLTVSGPKDTNTLVRPSYITVTDVAPSASFTGTPTSGSAPLGVQFTDTSTGTITNRFWDFGDGSTTNTVATQVRHFYSAGTYRIRLTVSGPQGSNTRQRNNYVSVTNAPARLLVTPTNQNFGSVVIGQTNLLPFQVINLGSFSLTGSVATTLPFRITTGSSFILVGGQTGQVMVAFSPTSAVSNSANVIFTSGAGNSTNRVTGTGVTAPQLVVSPSSLDFGTVSIGSTVQASFVVSNLGGPTTITGVASVGGGPFSIASGTPFVLPAFASTNLVVRFSPTETSSSSNVVIFSSNSGNSTNAVTGAGIVPLVANFSADLTTGLKPLSASFTDQSTGNITNRFWDFGDGSTTNTVSTTLTHSYVDAGLYTVTLTISGPLGVNTLRRDNYIVVNAPLRVTAIQVSGPDVVISFSSSPNQFYELEYTDTLTPAGWNPAVSSIPGNSGTVTVTHPGGATPGFRFYRIRQLP
jgi:PKD repeat protein